MKAIRILALPLLVAAVACSSENKPDQDPGLTGDGTSAAGTAPDTNPDGKPYPTDNVGTRARVGSTPGNRIANYKFMGYPDGNPASGLQPMSLAQFYDPTGQTHKLIHIQASGVWCVYCQKEAQTVAPMTKELADRKVVWIISLAEGPAQGSAATQKDLDGWINEFKDAVPHVLDPANKNLGVFYDAAALPWQANINAETMEILSSGTGALTTEAAILQELDEWIGQIDSGKLTLK